MKESTASRILLKRVDSMIGRLDKTLAELEKKEATLQAQLKEAGTPEAEQKSELVHIDEIMCAIIKVRILCFMCLKGQNDFLLFPFSDAKSLGRS